MVKKFSASITQPLVIPLWADGEINPAGWDQPEEIAYLADGLKVIRNVVRPSLTASLPHPTNASGTAVIVAPGGAYHFLAYEHEGTQVADWLNRRIHNRRRCSGTGTTTSAEARSLRPARAIIRAIRSPAS